MTGDADVFRGALEMAMCLARRDEVLARPPLVGKFDAGESAQAPQLPGPDRSSLLRLLA